jgi:exonuclease III
MKIATFNINNVKRRLPNLLQWLKAARPDIACLQELKATDAEFPADAIRGLSRGMAWAEDLERSRHPRARQRADPDPHRAAGRRR